MSKCSRNTERDVISNSVRSMKVLVVDEKKDLLASVGCLLCSCSFEVTCADSYGLALRLLYEKENEFDLLLIDRDITGVDVYTFLRLTKHMDLLSMVMSEEDDDTLVLEALKCGAFLVLKRPLNKDVAMRIRHYVTRERIRKHDECQNKNVTHKAARIEENLQDNRSFGRKRKFWASEDDDKMKKKMSMEWTQELHDKFLNAVIQLGEGRCYPKEILELMGVPGLTRMQVASHLQKCRHGRCKYTEKGRMVNSLCNISPQGVDESKFGCKSSLQSDQNEGEDRIHLIDLNLSLNGRWTEVNHMNNQTFRGSPTMNRSSKQNNRGQGSIDASSSNRRPLCALDDPNHLGRDGPLEDRDLNRPAPKIEL